MTRHDACAAGDVVLVRFDPAFGHEQAGTRPALVISRHDYNLRSSFLIVCPITRNARPWPFKLPLPASSTLDGFVLADQLKSIDQRRIARRLGTVGDDFMSMLRALVDLVLAEAGTEAVGYRKA